MKTIYLVKNHSLQGIYPQPSVRDKGAFETYHDAEAFMMALIKDCGYEEWGEEYYYREYYSIDVIPLGETAMPDEINTTLYDIQGKKIQQFEKGSEEHLSYEKKFSRGSFVYVPPYPWNPYSNRFVPQIFVVAGLPNTREYVLEKGWDIEEWEPLYLLDSVSDDGYYTHDHVVEAGIQSFSGEIPPELSFLNVLSRHYKGVREIPLSDWIPMRKGLVRLKPDRTWSGEGSDLEI